MPRKNKRDEKRDPRERKFLAGDPVDELYIKPLRRRDKWKQYKNIEDFNAEYLEEENDSDE